MFQSLPPRIRTFYSFLTDYYAGRLMDDRLPNSQPSQVRPPAARAYQDPTVPPIARLIPRMIPEPGTLFVFLFEISANIYSRRFFIFHRHPLSNGNNQRYSARKNGRRCWMATYKSWSRFDFMCVLGQGDAYAQGATQVEVVGWAS